MFLVSERGLSIFKDIILLFWTMVAAVTPLCAADAHVTEFYFVKFQFAFTFFTDLVNFNWGWS